MAGQIGPERHVSASLKRAFLRLYGKNSYSIIPTHLVGYKDIILKAPYPVKPFFRKRRQSDILRLSGSKWRPFLQDPLVIKALK
ncbi:MULTISPECIES: hypothetical protein [unclassified Paenibacillus]|uniref:hypothetical protein n=1 Tax=unclassified Paenibacillus TaxID=185978 RepID=UPI0030FBB407